jgi:hypothetical protein
VHLQFGWVCYAKVPLLLLGVAFGVDKDIPRRGVQAANVVLMQQPLKQGIGHRRIALSNIMMKVAVPSVRVHLTLFPSSSTGPLNILVGDRGSPLTLLAIIVIIYLYVYIRIPF